LALVRRETLTAQELSGVIDLLQGASQDQAAFVLTKPREALALVHGMPTALKDPRLSRAGNWLASFSASLTLRQRDFGSHLIRGGSVADGEPRFVRASES
jgi:hypothetical protein